MSRGEGSGEGVHVTLLSLQSNGRTGTVTSPGVWLHNKTTDLNVCVSEESSHGEGGVVYDICCQIHYRQMVTQKQTRDRDLGFGCVINLWVNEPECMCERVTREECGMVVKEQ